MISRIKNWGHFQQALLGVCVPVVLFVLVVTYSFISWSLSPGGAAINGFFNVVFSVAAATGVSAVAALILMIYKLPWVALGIMIADTLPLLVMVGCYLFL